MNKNLILVLAAVLVGIGLLKPDLTNLLSKPNTVVVDNIVVVTPPSDEKARQLCEKVTKEFNSSNKKADAKRLSSLYMDISNLIGLDGENQIVKNTNEVRQINSLSGILLQLDIKGKYPTLAENAKAVIVHFIGDDDILLTPELRGKTVDGFRALSWACNEATK